MDYNELQQMTVIKLREEVKKFPDVKGVTGMKKDELIQLLVDKLGIEVTEKQAKKTKKTKTQKVLSKDDLKKMIQVLKEKRQVAASQKNKKDATILRRRIHRLKRRVRSFS